MRRFLALLRREARDARLLTIGAAAVALGGSIAANEFFLHYREGALTATYLVPGLVALYLVAIAADLVASDVATRRVETLALLPARPLGIWTAKAAFLIVAGALFLASVVAIQIGLHLVAGSREALDDMLRSAELGAHHLALAAPLVAAVLFFSTILERGFAAALAGLLACGGMGYGLAMLPWSRWEVRIEPWHALAVAGGVGAAFAAGSALAFAAGRIHLGGRLRRAVLGLAVVTLLLGLPAAAGARALGAWLALEPGDAGVVIHGMLPSPDGRTLALTVSKERSHRSRAWLLRVEDGRVLPVPGFSVEPGEWTDEGLLRVRVIREAGWRSTERLDAWIDPETARAVRTRSPEPVAERLTAGWASVRDRRVGPARFPTVAWPARGIERELGDVAVFVTPVPGTVLAFARSGRRTGEERRVALLDLEAGTERLYEVEDGWAALSPDGRRLATSTRVLDVETGETVAGPFEPGISCWPAGRRDSRLLLRCGFDRGGLAVLDLDGGGRVEVGGWSVAVLADDRLVVLREDRATVDLLDAKGRIVRRLLGPRQ